MNRSYSETQSKVEGEIIGCLLLDSQRVLALASDRGLTRAWFSNPTLAEIWDSASSLSTRGIPVDAFSIESEVTREKPHVAAFLGEFGFGSLLQKLVDGVPTVEHAAYYIDELHKEYVRRAAKRLANELAGDIDGRDDPDARISEAAKELLDITAAGNTKSKEEVKESILVRWRAAKDGGGGGIGCPWKDFGKRLGGCHRGVVTLLTGRGGKGKSSAVATWAVYLGSNGVRVGWLPLEDGCERTYARTASILGNFSSYLLDTGGADNDKLDEAQYHLDRVMAMPIFMDDRHMYIDQIFAWTMRQVAQNGIQILFIDAWKDILRRKHDLGEDESISRVLCELARRANIPIVVNHHVRKDGSETKNERLTEADIRGTGQIANDARQIIILQNEVNPDGTERFEFDIAKNSYGPTGRFPMVRISKWNKWVEPGDYPVGGGG